MIIGMSASLIRRACAAALLVTSTLVPAVAAAPQPGAPAPESKRALQARLLGEKTVPHKLDFQGTTVGGLSGIDRDRCTGEYVLISDDRSFLQPARFYTAKLDIDAAGVHAVDFTSTHPSSSRTARSTRPPPSATARRSTRRRSASTRATAATGGGRRATGPPSPARR